ncbi:MAG: hypothetical protein AAGG75_04935 [Bacteroidota bacterium]
MQENEEAGYLEESLHLPCPSCGSGLSYSAEKKKISCDYCGYLEEVDNSSDKVVEQSLNQAVKKVKDFSPEASGKKVFDCQNCGAKFMVEQDEVNVSCGFCGSTNVNLEAFKHQYIQPIGIIPFYISRQEANVLFKKWVKKGVFHPNKLKTMASVELLHGVYIPFWTYDAHTESDWSGERGDYYYVSKQVRVNGKMETRQERKIRWSRRSGHLRHFFDDVLVIASGGLEQKYVERILPFRLGEVVNFDPRLLVGWETEVYQLEVDEGYQVADQIMDHKIRNMCSAQLGGDTQRNLRVSSHKEGQTFKHIYLPIWICAYNYNNKTYRFSINGQTGRVHGKKPLSWVKIAITVLFFILLIVGVWYLRESGVLKE